MPILETIAFGISGLGITLPQLVLMVTALGSMIFVAASFRLGVMMLFFMFGSEFLIFWRISLIAPEIITAIDMSIVTLAFLASFVIMTISLLMTKAQNTSGGII